MNRLSLGTTLLLGLGLGSSLALGAGKPDDLGGMVDCLEGLQRLSFDKYSYDRVSIEGKSPINGKSGVYVYTKLGQVKFFYYPDSYLALSPEKKKTKTLLLCNPDDPCEVSTKYTSKSSWHASSGEPGATEDGAWSSAPFVTPGDFGKEFSIGGGFDQTNNLPKNKEKKAPDPDDLIKLRGGDTLDLSSPERAEARMKPLRDAIRDRLSAKRLELQGEYKYALEYWKRGQKITDFPPRTSIGPFEIIFEKCLKATADSGIKTIISGIAPSLMNDLAAKEKKAAPSSGNTKLAK